MAVTISDEVLHSAGLNEAELKAEIALTLFQQDRLTLGQAAACPSRGHYASRTP
jgi:predicted HTH domain antitoxin